MLHRLLTFFFFFFNDTATTEIYTLSLHDALPIWPGPRPSLLFDHSTWLLTARCGSAPSMASDSTNRTEPRRVRSEEHTSELQSRSDLVCRLLLEKKKHIDNNTTILDIHNL